MSVNGSQNNLSFPRD